MEIKGEGKNEKEEVKEVNAICYPTMPELCLNKGS